MLQGLPIGRQIGLGLPRQTVRQSSTSSPAGVLDYDIFRPKAAKKGDAPPPLSEHVPPIVFMHGLLGHRKNNRTAARLLANQLRTTLICPDLRNHGTSFHASPHNNGTMSDDLSVLLEHLKKEVDLSRGVIMMGHSMGGKVALIHGLRYPEIVKGIVTIDNIPYRAPYRCFGEFEKFHTSIQMMRKLCDKGTLTDVGQVSDALMKYLGSSKKEVDFLTNNLHKNPLSKRVVSRIPLDIINDSIEDLIEFKMYESGDLDDYGVFHGPMLVIRANFSPFVGYEVHEHLIRQHYDNYSIEGIDSGHWIVTENRLPFVKMVTHWVTNSFK